MVTTLRQERLTDEAFEPFGRVLSIPARGPDATGPGWRWWAETALLAGDDRPWGVGYLDIEPASLRIDWAERHLRTVEAIIATSGDLLVYVGEANPPEQLERPPVPERFRVFRVPAGGGVVLDKGVWHGAPFSDAPTSALVLILEGTGRDDVTVVRFPDSPVEIETRP